MEKKYRKYLGRFEFWHFHPDCPDWPQANYTHRSEISAKARICPQCMDLRANGSAVNGEKKNPSRCSIQL